MIQQKLIAVIGGRESTPETKQKAFEVGQLVARRGDILICGGRMGIMESACKGAVEAGGTTVGILPGTNIAGANPYVQIPIATGIGIARNPLIIQSCHGAIAIDGKYGTLSEIAYCFQMFKPVCSLNSWDIEGVPQFKAPEEAVNYIYKQIANPKPAGPQF